MLSNKLLKGRICSHASASSLSACSLCLSACAELLRMRELSANTIRTMLPAATTKPEGNIAAPATVEPLTSKNIPTAASTKPNTAQIIKKIFAPFCRAAILSNRSQAAHSILYCATVCLFCSTFKPDLFTSESICLYALSSISFLYRCVYALSGSSSISSIVLPYVIRIEIVHEQSDRMNIYSITCVSASVKSFLKFRQCASRRLGLLPANNFRLLFLIA